MTIARISAPAARLAAAGARALSSSADAFPAPLFLTAKATGSAISAWHDIPLRPTSNDPQIFNYVCEIPRGAKPKFEIATDLPGNPIIQDKTKAGKPRFYAYESLTNYGAIPQTYEDPDHKDAWTGLLGDGDPIDVCEIGSRLAATGDAYSVKVLGALAMIDGGETDWKVLGIRSDDPLAAKLSCVSKADTPDSVKKLMDDIRHWFRTYKVPEGKGENEFAFDGAWLDAGKTLEIIASTNKQWKKEVDARTGVQAKKAPWLPPMSWSASQLASLSGTGAALATGTTTKA